MRKLLVAAALSAGLLLPGVAQADTLFEGCNDLINYVAGSPSDPNFPFNLFGLSPSEFAKVRNHIRQEVCHGQELYGEEPD
jgi:hypothetical protein